MFSGLRSKLLQGLHTKCHSVGHSKSIRSLQIRSGTFPPYGTYTYRMNLEPYTPEMMDVNVVDGEIVVKGKIEERVGEDRWSYEFVKRHRLPENVDLSTVKTSFDKGQLIVTAKMKM